MTWPPEGELLSLPADNVEAPCQIVPVVFVKKWRVPVDVEIGSAQAWKPEPSAVAPLQAVVPVGAALPVIDTE